MGIWSNPIFSIWDKLGYPSSGHEEDNGTIVSTIHHACDSRTYVRNINASIVQSFLETKLIDFRYLLMVGNKRAVNEILLAIDNIEPKLVKNFGLISIGGREFTADDLNGVKHHEYSTGCLNFSEHSKDKNKNSLICLKSFPFPNDNEKVLLMKGALAVIYIPKYEGFGMPVLEGLCAGTIVITRNSSSMPEAGGPDAPLYLSINDDINELSTIIKFVITMDSLERERRISAGFAYADLVGDWNRSARQFFQHLIGTKHRHSQCYI